MRNLNHSNTLNQSKIYYRFTCFMLCVLYPMTAVVFLSLQLLIYYKPTARRKNFVPK